VDLIIASVALYLWAQIILTGRFMRKFYILVSFSLLLLLHSTAFPQTQGTLGRRFFSNWSVSISGGPNIFFGDLKVHRFWPANVNMNEWRFAGSFMLIRQLSHVFALRGQLLYGGISGTKRDYKSGIPANLYFEGNIFEYNLNATINFSNLLFRYKPDRTFFIYGTVGVGLSNWYTRVKDLNTHEQISRSGSPSNWTTEIVIPAGLGAYYNIGDKVNLGLEWTLRALNSDKLDGTISGYPYDMYTFLSLNLTYNFNKPNTGKLKPAKYSTPKGISLPPPPSNTPKAPEQEKEGYEKLVLPPPLSITPEPVEQKIEAPTMILRDTTTSQFAEPVVQGISYRVQVFATHTETYTEEDMQSRLKLSMQVTKEISDGWYRFTVGLFTKPADAVSLMKQMRARGIKGAFVVKYLDGNRVPLNPKK